MKLNITQQLKDILKEYSDEVMHASIEALEKVGEEAAEELHTAGDFEGTKYRKSWTSETETKRTFASVKVYNKKHYRLTHLLENGHRKVGPKGGFVDPRPHIGPVNEKAQEKAVEEIIKLVEKIK